MHGNLGGVLISLQLHGSQTFPGGITGVKESAWTIQERKLRGEKCPSNPRMEMTEQKTAQAIQEWKSTKQNTPK
jgi:hypothetical protein